MAAHSAPSALEILELRSALEDEWSDRDYRFDKIDANAGGSHAIRALKGRWHKEGQAWFPEFVNKKNQPGDRIAVEVLQPIIEQKRAMIGVVPQKNCPMRRPGDDGEYSSRLERVYFGMWRESEEGAFWGDVAWFLPRYGASVAGIWPRVDRNGITWPDFIVRSPRYFYPVRKDAKWRELSKCVFVTEYTPYEAKTEFPDFRNKIALKGNSQTVEVDAVEITEYWDDWYRIRVHPTLGILDTFEHRLSFCPWIVIPNIGIPGTPFGDSDIEFCFTLAQLLNLRLSKENDYINYIVDPPIHINNPDDMPSPIPRGPGAVWTTRDNGGKAEFVGLPSTSYQWEQSMQRIFDLIDRMADAPSPLRSDFGGPLNSSKAFNSMLGPVTGRIKLREGYIYPKVARLSEMGMEAHILWNGRRQITTWGFKPGDRFTETYRPSEFKTWHPIVLSVDERSYMDSTSSDVLDMQKVGMKMLSRETAMRNNPKIEDVAAELERIRKEAMEDVQLAVTSQMYAQAMANQGQNQAMQEPGSTNYQMERGKIASTPPMAVPGVQGPPKALPAAGGTMPPGAPPLLQKVADMIRELPVRGEVYVGGDIVATGEVTEFVDCFLTDMNDKAAIVNGLSNAQDPEVKALHGKFHFAPMASRHPEEPTLNVTPGTQGYEPEGTPSESPATAQSPEMAMAGAPAGGA